MAEAKTVDPKKKKKKSKKKKWIRLRHLIVTRIAYCIMYPYSRLKYGVRIRKFKEQEKRPYLVLLNHQTPFDQFFVGMSFKGTIYYMATEDIFSKGWISSLIRYLVAPIPIKKQTADISAILNCMRVAGEGGSIAIAPEGNRTYSGRTEYMNPSIVALARKLGLPVVLYRIEGGYGVHPRWSDVVRRGKMEGYVSRVIHPEEYKEMDDDAFFAAIREGLYVNEACVDGEFRHKKLAEYLERALYVCPNCGLAPLESQNDVIECTLCHKKVRYLPTKELHGEGFDLPFRFVADWYDYQSDFVNNLDVTEMTEEPLFVDRAAIWSIIPCKSRKKIISDATLRLYGDRVEILHDGGEMRMDFENLSAVTVLGRNKLNLYFGDQLYQVKGGKRFNALKYVQIYHRHKNIVKGERYAKFLGL